MKKLLPVIIAILCFSAIGHSQTAPTTFETDFQLWNDTQFILPLTKKKDWNAVLWVFGRFGNNVRTTTDARISGLITKKVNKYVTLGGGYLYRYSNTSFVRPRYESRYLALATFTAPLGRKFTLVNRDQFQYEDRYSRPNAVVIRPKLTLKREITLGKTKIDPFVSVEPFYDTRLKGFARYREQIGFSRKFSSQFSADFFYVRQDETGNGTRPGTLNGIGTSFKVTVLK